jgi:hypothetical protein
VWLMKKSQPKPPTTKSKNPKPTKQLKGKTNLAPPFKKKGK